MFLLLRRRRPQLASERLLLRLPQHSDFRAWVQLRQASTAHLVPWEPTWAPDHFTRRAFTARVTWAARAEAQGTALPLFLIRQSDQQLLGAITLDNIRRGPAQACTIGYWRGAPYARQGYMREAVQTLCFHAFTQMDLSRLESACLPENIASRAVLERCGFKHEGVAQAYLQINGRWRNHVLYANLRGDRRGRTDVG
jgi:[ribosomal protein S5]-alanine N-acetyltransferase